MSSVPDPATDEPRLIDLDHAATAPLRPEALAAMEPFMVGPGGSAGRYGNPSGSHTVARDALRALDEARELVAFHLGCGPGDVVFTSGGTEADNHAITGGMPPRDGVPVCTSVEHHAVLAPTQALGGAVVRVDRLGRVDPDDLARTLDALAGGVAGGIGVVSVMAANNELGTRNDLTAVADVVRRHAPHTLLHTDAVQSVAWFGPDVLAGSDMFSVSAHKLGGPKGVGALVVKGDHSIRPLLRGGSQERDRRAGTQNVAGIVGFAAALAVVASGRSVRRDAVSSVRDTLADRLVAEIDDVVETVGPALRATLGEPADRAHLLPGHCHLTVGDATSEELLLLLERRGICASAASSCASGSTDASHVLEAIGRNDPPVRSGSTGERAALRLSLGDGVTHGDVDHVVGAMADSIGHLRESRAGRRQRSAERRRAASGTSS